jgi:hypothetical protein
MNKQAFVLPGDDESDDDPQRQANDKPLDEYESNNYSDADDEQVQEAPAEQPSEPEPPAPEARNSQLLYQQQLQMSDAQKRAADAIASMDQDEEDEDQQEEVEDIDNEEYQIVEEDTQQQPPININTVNSQEPTAYSFDKPPQQPADLL